MMLWTVTNLQNIVWGLWIQFYVTLWSMVVKDKSLNFIYHYYPQINMQYNLIVPTNTVSQNKKYHLFLIYNNT